MPNSQVYFSQQIFNVLSRYPKWLTRILQVVEKPVIDKNYCPQVIEVFDQHGLLAGRVHGRLSYECSRVPQQTSDFMAWLIDGEIAVFYVGSELVINRVNILALTIGEFL
jgi:hypothetical protein